MTEKPNVAEQFIPKGAMLAGKIAMRAEDGMWNAYVVPPDEIVDAMPEECQPILLASISLVICEKHPKRRDEFLELVRGMVCDAFEVIYGERPQSVVVPRESPDA